MDSKLTTKDKKDIDESVGATETTALVTLDESYFKANASVGLEDLTPDELPTPFLTLIGTNSTLADANGMPYPRGAFVYRANGEVFDEVDCTILSRTKTTLPSFSDKTIMEPAYVVLGVLNDGFKPFKLILKSTGIGAFKQFLGSVNASHMPMFCLMTSITSEKIQGEKGVYYKIKFTVKGMHQDNDKIILLEELAKTYGPKMKEEAVEEANPMPF